MTLRLLSLLTFALVLGQTTEQDASPLANLTAEQQQVLESLSYNTFLNEVVNDSRTLSVELLEQVMNDIQSGIADEEEHDSENAGVLELTPELLLDQYWNGSTSLNRRQFLQYTFMITSCLMNQNCVLESHEDHDHDDENHDDHDHEDDEHNHEDDEDHDEHDHEDSHDHEERESRSNDDHDHESHDTHGHDDHDDHDDHHDNDDDDDDTTVPKVIAIIVFFFEAMIGALIPITMNTSAKLDEVLSIVNCFSGGVLLTTGIIHMIPHVVEYEDLADGIDDYPAGLLIVVASFVLVFYIEHILFDVHSHTDAHEEGQSETQHIQEKETGKNIESIGHRVSVLKHGLVILAATSFHSILEAFVIGIEDETYGVWLLFATVAAHKGVTAMALGSRMQKAGATMRESLLFALLFALTAPISILIGTAMSDVPNTVNLIFTGMSTGTFLYIGAYEVISEEFQEKPKHMTDPNNAPTAAYLKKLRYLKFVAIVIGMLCIAAAAFIPHHHHGHDDHGH
eukprot:g7336.t1